MTVVSPEKKEPADTICITLTVGAPAGPQAVAESYAIRVHSENGQRTIAVRGADAAGVMYGGLDVAEAIRTGTFDSLEGLRPHTAHRAARHQDQHPARSAHADLHGPVGCGAGQHPRDVEHGVLARVLDDMARHRYNVLTLVDAPSVPQHREGAGVSARRARRCLAARRTSWTSSSAATATISCGRRCSPITRSSSGSPSTRRSSSGATSCNWPRIAAWTSIGSLWNVFLYGAEGKDGITSDEGDPRTIEYFRASVRETVKTYPLLAGFGITAGESMAENIGGMTKEQWLWKTYGEGIRDGLKDTPERKFRLIHRFHMTALSEIQKEFAELPCPLDLSFKYAIAHMYSVPNPGMIQPVLPLLSPGTPLLAHGAQRRHLQLPLGRRGLRPRVHQGDSRARTRSPASTWGRDGYHWGRDFLSKDAGDPRQTVMHKQWLSFALWGRLAYDPDLPAATFERLVAARFPGADARTLTAAWADASKTFP